MTGKDKFNVDGSLVVVTGGNGGLGKETARKLSWKGASVVIACRDLEKAAVAKRDIEADTGNPVRIMHLDLSSFSSIREFVEKLTEKYGTPDVLINNAAVYMRKHRLSHSGIEMTVAVNYYGTFYLTSLLLPEMLGLSGEARVVNVVSDSYRVGKFMPDLGKASKLSGFRAYSLSKRALMYYTFELAEKLKKTNITVNCVHPGHSATGIWPKDVWYWKLASPLISLNADPASYAAENILYAATSTQLSGVTGKYIMNLEIADVREGIFTSAEQKSLWEFTLAETERIINGNEKA